MFSLSWLYSSLVSPLNWLTCCCWKDLSLFLKREGRTKSHPLARKASSPLKSGSCRNDVSLIIIVGDESCNLPVDMATDASTDTLIVAFQAAKSLKRKVKRNPCWTPMVSTNQNLVEGLRNPKAYPKCSGKKEKVIKSLNPPILTCVNKLQSVRPFDKNSCGGSERKGNPQASCAERFYDRNCNSGRIPAPVTMSALDRRARWRLAGACRFELGSDKLHIWSGIC